MHSCLPLMRFMEDVKEIQKSFAKWIRQMNKKGVSPGTSTNYSFLHPNENELVISKSGIDKSYFKHSDFMRVTHQGEATEAYSDENPSAETLIHCELYRLFPETRFILHSHSKAATLLSDLFLSQGYLSCSGYEVLKGLPNISTHEATLELPIFENSQDMVTFSTLLRDKKSRLTNAGFLMAKHGLYAWGKSFLEAKRHIEIYEFLLDCELTLLQLNK